MTWTIIVASGETVQRGELEEAAAEIAARIDPDGGRARIRAAVSVADIEALRNAGRDPAHELIIVTASLPAVPSSPDRKGWPGLAFVKAAQAGPSPPACILASECPKHRDEIQDTPRCGFLTVGIETRYDEDCLALAYELDVCAPSTRVPMALSVSNVAGRVDDVVPADDVLARGGSTPVPMGRGAAPMEPGAGEGLVPVAGVVPLDDVVAHVARPSDQYSLIELHLRNKVQFSTIKLDVTVPGKERRESPAILDLKQRDVEKLLQDSRKLSERFAKALKCAAAYSQWRSDYRALGERIYKLLYTSDFVRYLSYVQGVDGHDARLRFNLEPDLRDGLWEAIYDPKDNRFLMLDATITRRDSSAVDQFSSRTDGKPGVLNVLAVDASVEDDAIPDGLDDAVWKKFWAANPLKQLSHVAAEVGAIKRLGADPSTWMRADILDGDKPAGVDWSLADDLEKKLKSDPEGYDVLHFSGYAVFAPSKPPKPVTRGRKKTAADRMGEEARGYLIFPGRPRPRAVPIARIADWLRNTSVELVYLSCCRSGSARAAAEFARNNMRMAIGFSWDLDSGKAIDFSKLFYEELLAHELKVCSAIREARSKLNRSYDAENPIWASPVLVAQPSNWPDVEGVLRPPDRRAKPQPNGSTRISALPLPGAGTMEKPSDNRGGELSYNDKQALIEKLAEWSIDAEPSGAEYFQNLVRRADFSSQHKFAGTAGYKGDAIFNAGRLVDWAAGLKTNPKDGNRALGSILNPMILALGLEDQTFVAGLIVSYRLLSSDVERDALRIRYQIARPPAVPAVDVARPLLQQPSVTWAAETEQLVLQGWFAPEPEWLDVGALMQAAKRARSVCRVEVGATHMTGTGVLVGSDLVLTNYHVLGIELGTPVATLAERAPSTVLRFGAFSARGATPQDGQQVKLAAEKPIVASSPEYDFVLLRTDGSISKAADVEPFGQLGRAPTVRDALYVLQHPQGGPMKLGLSTSGITWVDPGKVTLQYTTRVASGSSGSPCFDADWNLTALHHAGSASKGEGILMASIFDRIKEFLAG